MLSTNAPVSEWHRYRTRQIPLAVTFADSAQVVKTLEGGVSCNVGDAIVTGVKGEHWPVPRERFLATYDPVSLTRLGEDGQYCKKPREVMAGLLTRNFEVVLSGGRGTLQGNAGDVLVTYAPGDEAIVAPDVFARSYQLARD